MENTHTHTHIYREKENIERNGGREMFREGERNVEIDRACLCVYVS
jgi:hypothetical protein